VEKYGSTGDTADDRMHFARWIPKATITHSEYVILPLFHDNNGSANAPLCYIRRTMPGLFLLRLLTQQSCYLALRGNTCAAPYTQNPH